MTPPNRDTILAGILASVCLYVLLKIVLYAYNEGMLLILFLPPFLIFLIPFFLFHWWWFLEASSFIDERKVNLFATLIIGVSIIILGFGTIKIKDYQYVAGLIELSEKSVNSGNYEKATGLLKEASVKAVTKTQSKKIDYLSAELPKAIDSISESQVEQAEKPKTWRPARGFDDYDPYGGYNTFDSFESYIDYFHRSIEDKISEAEDKVTDFYTDIISGETEDKIIDFFTDIMDPF